MPLPCAQRRKAGLSSSQYFKGFTAESQGQGRHTEVTKGHPLLLSIHQMTCSGVEGEDIQGAAISRTEEMGVCFMEMVDKSQSE